MAVKTVGRAARERREDHGRRRWAVLGIAAAVALAVVFTAGALVGAGAKTPAAERAAADGSASAVSGGVPVGHPQTKAGAIAAASDYAQALARLSLVGESALARGQEEVFTPAAIAAVGEQARQEAATTRQELGASAAARHVPIGARLLEYTPERARVALWIVHITSDGRDTPTAWWMTEQVTLRWDGERWRVVDVAAGDGPVPAAGQNRPSARDALQQQLELTEALRHAG